MYNEQNNNSNLCMDWDDTIENDGQEFVILEEGDYNFMVEQFERSRYPGSAKIPPCNKAALTLAVMTDDGRKATVKFDLILYRTLEWKMAQFFRCIGLKKHGESFSMDWNKVIGSMGRARFKPRTYTNRDGEERQANDVVTFYDYDEKFFKNYNNWTEITNADELPFD